MKVQLTTRLGSMTITDATGIQFNGEDILVFSATNGFTKVTESELYEIRLAPSDPVTPTFSKVALVKHLREKNDMGLMEAYQKVREFLGE